MYNTDSFKPNIEEYNNGNLQYGTVVINPNGTALAEAALFSVVAEYSGSDQYFADAQPGVSTSDAAWRARKITYNASNQIIRVLWADGNSKFDNVATSLATLTYS